MRNAAFALVCAIALCVTVAAPPARAMDGSFVSAAARVEVRLVERLSSRDVKAGDLFHFETTASALVAGRFYSAETRGHGVVLEALPRRGRQPGRLVLAARSLDPSDAAPVEVGLEPGRPARTIDGDAVYEKGTLFVVDAPPPQSAGPVPAATGD